MLRYIKNSIIVLFLLAVSIGNGQEKEVSLIFDTSGYQKNMKSLSAFSSPANSNNDTIASIKGESSVSNLGGFNYVVPIDVPEGVNNFMPNISLVYDSHRGNGIAGWGWNISGLSMISAGAKSMELDSSYRPVQYDGEDPFYLDGSRLLSSDGVNFTTLIYSQIKIQKYKSGDYSFIIHYPNGKIAKYKEIKQTHMISEMLDANGNYVNYEYFIDNENVYLNKVTYGGGTFKNFIKFNYKNRIVSKVQYSRGKSIISNKVLDNIVVSIPNIENSVYRKYKFEHDFIHRGTIERLVKLAVENDKGHSLKPLKFTYTTQVSKGKLEENDVDYNKPKYLKGIGDVAIGDFMGDGKLTTIYEAEVLNTKANGSKARLIKVWNTRGGEISSYFDSNRRLFAGKALMYGKYVSNEDLLLSLKSDYSSNSNDQYTLYFHEAKYGISNKDGDFIKFSLPSITVENDFTLIPDLLSKEPNKKKKFYKSNDVEYPYDKLTGSKIRDKKHRKILLSDFNNDGLVDLLVFSPQGVDNTPKASIHFYEIGKLTRNKQDIVLKELTLSSDILFDINTNIFPIDFDGDGLAEFMTVDDKGNLQMLKVDLENLRVSKLDIGIEKLESSFTKKTPIIFGDFNGDGLTDFIVPDKVYDLDGSDAEAELTKMSKEDLYWWSYISTGTKFIKDKKNFKEQKLAYIVPSQHHDIKRSSDWKKFWSGTPDKYRGTEYGTSSILAMDVNGDGTTDLVSFRKFGKIKYHEYITLSDFSLDLGFESPLKDRDGIQFYLVGGTNSGDFKVDEKPIRNENGESGFSLAKKGVSPFSLILNKTDFNSLNAYKNGIIIHDPISMKEVHYTLNNDGFVEGQLKSIDNSTGSILSINYRPMSVENNNKEERIYTYNDLRLSYPYYVHKNNGEFQLVHKLNTIFDGKILTKEYRYHNGIQHLQGKGFIGFQQTKVSEVYESELNKEGKYQIKDHQRGMFWRTNTYDPLMDNVQISASYGSLKESALFSKSTIVNKQYNKEGKSYIIVAESESVEDYLNGFDTYKRHRYESTASNFYLTKTETDYYSLSLNGNGKNRTGSLLEEFSYVPKFIDNQSGSTFYGLFKEIKKTVQRENDVFTTREEFTYNTKGAISSSKKYGNNTEAITTEFEYHTFGGIKNEKVYTTGITPLITSYEYDKTHRFIVEAVSPDKLKSTSEVDIYGKIVLQVDGFGRKTRFLYDSWGNAHTVIDYLGNKVRTKKMSSQVEGAIYDVAVIGADGSESITSYDLFDRVLQVKVKTLNDKWIYTRTEYDVYNNVVRSSQPYYAGENVKWNTTKYDRLNRPIQIVNYTGRVYNTCYEKNKVTIEDGHKTFSKWVDAQGYEIKTQDQGGIILNSYYANGSLKESNYDGIRTSISIDGWGNKTKLVDPSAGTYTYEYDSFSRLKKTTTPNGGSTIYSYDELGRILEEKSSGGKDEDTSVSLSYKYDDKTKLPRSVSGNYNNQTFTYWTTYDIYGRVVSKVEDTPKFVYGNTFNYDSYGRIEQTEISTKLKDSGVTTISNVYNEYDKSTGILKIQREGVSKTAKIIWELNDMTAFGASKKVTYGNGYLVDNTYSSSDYLSNIKHSFTGNTLVDIDYTYDIKRGTLTNRNNKIFGKDERYTYDDLDRLLTESTNSTLVNTYTYDPRGRITSNTEVGKYNYNSKDYQIQSINFNDTGDKLVKERGFAVVKYNSFKSPNEIYLENKGRINYEFSILKSRYASYFGSVDEKSKQPIQKYYSSDKVVEIIVTKDKSQIITYLTGDPYSANYMKIDQVNGGSVSSTKNYFLHRDNQGTIVAISDSDGVNIEQRYFDAWGNLKSAKIKGVNQKINELGWTSSLLIDRGYTGHEHLYTVGLIHMNGRIYDPVLRRFLSPDNYVQDNTNTQNYNRYGYVLNNPLLYTDPSGEFFISGALITAIWVGAAIAVGTTVIINIANGVPFWYGMGKSAVMGGVSGAISFGIGSAASGLSSTLGQTTFLAQAGMHGVTGGLMSELDGSKFISGFASGAISSLISSGIGKLGPEMDEFGNITKDGILSSSDTKAMMIVGGGLSGGISSSIVGGDFMKGMQQGLITSGLNHAMHDMVYGDGSEKYDYTDKEKKQTRSTLGFKENDTAEIMIEKLLKGMKIGDYVEGKDLKFLDKNLPVALDKATMSSMHGRFEISRTFLGRTVFQEKSILTIKEGTLKGMKGYNFTITGVKLEGVYSSGFINGNKMYIYENGKLYSIDLGKK